MQSFASGIWLVFGDTGKDPNIAEADPFKTETKLPFGMCALHMPFGEALIQRFASVLTRFKLKKLKLHFNKLAFTVVVVFPDIAGFLADIRKGIETENFFKLIAR